MNLSYDQKEIGKQNYQEASGVTRRAFLKTAGAVLALPLLNRPAGSVTAAQTLTAPDWHFIATVAESCSCDVPCPCNWGSNATRMPCDGNRLISMRRGHYDGVDLAGVAFLITFTMRGWSKIYVSDQVNARQMAAVEALRPPAEARRALTVRRSSRRGRAPLVSSCRVWAATPGRVAAAMALWACRAAVASAATAARLMRKAAATF